MSQIVPMGVSDVYFLVKRLGSDCDPYQQYRELTQNSIEAVLRARKKGLLGSDEGEVIWDVDWYALEKTGVYRACIADNGDGMSAEDLGNYINRLSASHGIQSLTDNYGVGAKIAAATRNPAGLVYQAWQGGNGILGQLVIDHDAKSVGFRRWEVEDGLWKDFLDNIATEARPSPIESHGVSVSLLGKSEGDHTFLGPDGLNTAYHSWWLFRTLNRRYFRLPMAVKVRVFQSWDVEKWPKSIEDANSNSLMRTVFGQERYLKKYSLASGQVELNGATAHYFVMDPEKGTDQRQFFEPGGHIAALYQDELLEMRTGNAGRKLLQNFGAVFSAKHIVIYVEPSPELGEITTNTSRTELVVDGRPLPWMDWADQFRDQLPAEIKELESEIALHGTASSHSDSIRDRLKKIHALYKVTRYKPVAAGTLEAEGETLGGVSKVAGTTKRSASNRQGGKKGGAAGSEYLAAQKPNGAASNPVETRSVEPRTDWVSVKDETREQGDIEDRAARYIHGEHRLLINGDFRVFTDMITYFGKQYSSLPSAENVISDVVREWFEQQLVEAVMGVRAIEGSRLWPIDSIGMALSEEALTTAVMPRYHTWASVKRELARRLVNHSPAAEVAG